MTNESVGSGGQEENLSSQFTAWTRRISTTSNVQRRSLTQLMEYAEVNYRPSILVFSELLNDPASRKNLCEFGHFHEDEHNRLICNRSAKASIMRYNRGT